MTEKCLSDNCLKCGGSLNLRWPDWRHKGHLKKERVEIDNISKLDPLTLDEFREIDRRFHSLIASACGNKLLEEIYAKALASLFGSNDFHSLLYSESNREEVREIIESSTLAHRLIADAIVSSDKRKTIIAVESHLVDVERRIIERLV